MNPFSFILLPSPFGKLSIVWQESKKKPKVHRIFLPKESVLVEDLVQNSFPGAKALSCPAIDELSIRIQDFLKGEAITFSLDIVVIEKCSDDQKKILMADYDIPRGCVAKYWEVAKQAGIENRRGAQNAGTALKENPFPIIFPCHRVIKSDGSLGGYQGGTKMKRALLELEGIEFLPNGKVRMNKICYCRKNGKNI